MGVKKGENLCVAHSPQLPACPECGTRLPSSGALKKHLRQPLCPTLKQRQHVEAEPYFASSVNGLEKRNDLSEEPTTLTVVEGINDNIAASSLRTTTTLVRVSQLTDRLLPQLQAQPIGLVPSLEVEDAVRLAWSNERDSTFKMEPKHFPQISALAALALHPFPLIDSSAQSHVAVVDLAAGRAYTALYLAHVLWLRGVPLRLIAVDRVSTRYKADRTLRTWVSVGRILSFRRLTIDLCHLDLSGLDECISASDVRIIGKHMCGAALDLALTAVTNFARSNHRPRNSVTLVFASCCRKLCIQHLFGDRGNVWRQLNVNKSEFEHLCTVAQWGLDVSHSDEMSLIGCKCREIIDSVRVHWLNANGWRTKLGCYTDASPEDACLVAIWDGMK